MKTPEPPLVETVLRRESDAERDPDNKVKRREEGRAFHGSAQWWRRKLVPCLMQREKASLIAYWPI